MSNNLPTPFENFLARSLMKGNSLFVYRHKNNFTDIWVVFYRPIKIKKRLPRRLNNDQIVKLAEQLALFHKSCHQIRHTLPPSSKTLQMDIDRLLNTLDTEEGKFEYRMYADEIREHSGLFHENCEKLNANSFNHIPVFIDWNIGNFSVSNSFKLFSRWDYDWFRIGTRLLDFYFLSRVVSDIGDRTVFSYYINPLMEDRFILFLKAYHAEFPLERNEILFLKEAYRFFILNYVIKDSKYFFHKIFAAKLQREAYDIYLPSIEKEFNADKILKALNL